MFIGCRKIKKPEFREVFREGKTVKGDFIVLKILKNKKNYSRPACVVSLGVSKLATKRNKIKRRIREALRGLSPIIRNGYDIIVITRPKILEKNFSEIKEEIYRLLSNKIN